MMKDMMLTQMPSCRNGRQAQREWPSLRIEEEPHLIRLTLDNEHQLWLITLPVDGFAYSQVSYQMSTGDAERSVVLELKLDGDLYRRTVSKIRGGASREDILEVLRILALPIMPLFDLIEPANGLTSVETQDRRPSRTHKDFVVAS